METAGKSPKTLFWEVTNRCNLSCGTCYNKNFLNDKRHTLTLEEGERRCRDIVVNGVANVIFLGGEPLADRNLFHYLEILRAANVRCSLSTNGTLISPAVAERLAGLDLKLVAVSLDGGTPASNDLIRGKGSFERILRGVRNLVAVRTKAGPRIAVALTLTAENSEAFAPFFTIMAELGIADIFVNKYTKVNHSTLSTSPAADFLLTLDELCRVAVSIADFYLYLPTMPRVADYLSAKHGLYVSAKEQSCGAVDDAILLSDDGHLYPCSMARASRPEFRKDYVADWAGGAIAELMTDFVAERERMWSDTPAICRDCRYRESCAQKCVLNSEQSKYHEACEALRDLARTDGALEMAPGSPAADAMEDAL